MSDPRRKGWWNVPDYFHSPLVFDMEEDQEDYIFGKMMLLQIRDHPLTEHDLELHAESGSSLWIAIMNDTTSVEEVPHFLRFPLTVAWLFWGFARIIRIHNFTDLHW
ncbi:KH homology domain-containing protein 1A-like [Mus pahari]|uniref:KH homology domain-containing protein 1A-like n=1 Tax=Mus pahari TaxID=10093 RepID=UPI000A313C59|nr:KH homology domain-containing protein 1A-like [Mus pahari]